MTIHDNITRSNQNDPIHAAGMDQEPKRFIDRWARKLSRRELTKSATAAAVGALILGKSAQAGATNEVRDLMLDMDFRQMAMDGKFEISGLPDAFPSEAEVQQQVDSGVIKRYERPSAAPMTVAGLSSRRLAYGGIFYSVLYCTSWGCVVSLYQQYNAYSYAYLGNRLYSCSYCRYCCY